MPQKLRMIIQSEKVVAEKRVHSTYLYFISHFPHTKSYYVK
jgi:hypothetical protein